MKKKFEIETVNGEGEFRVTKEIARKLGPALVGAAQKKRKDVLANSLLACTEDFYRQIEVMEQRIVEAESRIKELRQRLNDIKDGKWEMNREGRIVFPHLPPPHIG